MSVDVSARDVEELDGIGSILTSALNDMQKDWVTANSVTIPFKEGDRVTFKHCGQQMTGEVLRLVPHLAQVVVDVHDRSGCPIVNVEDATAA